MAFKVNYNQQRADRNRVKEQRKQERLARRVGEKDGDDPEDGAVPEDVSPENPDPTPPLLPKE